MTMIAEPTTAMRIIANRGELLAALEAASSIAARRNFKPVLQCVKLACTGDRLEVLATDLECAVQIVCAQVQVEAPGETCVSAEKLRDVVRKITDDAIQLQLKLDHLIVIARNSQHKINALLPADFPPVPAMEGEPSFEVGAEELRRLIAQTRFAIDDTESRYAFHGSKWAAEKNKLECVATEGHMMAMATGAIADCPKPVSAIVPKKTIEQIAKLIADEEGNVSVQITDNAIFVRGDSFTLASNLIEGQFPPHKDYVPTDPDKKITAGTADLLAAIESAALMASETAKGIRMEFSKAGVRMTAVSPEAGESDVSLPCKFEGADITIGFNPQLLISAIRAANKDEVTFEMTAPNRPGVVRAGGNYLCVLMPVNLQ
jgi:DNA polymerase-3 subunit beta